MKPDTKSHVHQIKASKSLQTLVPMAKYWPNMAIWPWSSGVFFGLADETNHHSCSGTVADQPDRSNSFVRPNEGSVWAKFKGRASLSPTERITYTHIYIYHHLSTYLTIYIYLLCTDSTTQGLLLGGLGTSWDAEGVDLTVTNIVLTLPCIAPSRGPARAIATLAVKSISHMDISGSWLTMIQSHTVLISWDF